MTSDHDGATLDYVLARASDPDSFERWALQGRSARWCSHPVRLSGAMTTVDPDSGEVVGHYSTAGEPDGTPGQSLRATAGHRLRPMRRGLPGGRLAPHRRRATGRKGRP